MLKRAFTGFKALPENGVVTTANWWNILGVSQNASLTEVKHAYREMCKTHHPDVGGNESDFVRITEAYEQAISLMSSNTNA
jgi:preprotein translocase subunit Sec63